jgi:uncharacterized phage-associated protein
MTDADKLILNVLSEMNRPVNSTKLVKLVYLVDYLHAQYFGNTVTGFQYMWDHFGPNAVGHAIIVTANQLSHGGLATCLPSMNMFGGVTADFTMGQDTERPTLPPQIHALVDDVVRHYGHLSLDDITAVTKETEPFRAATQFGLLSMNQTAPAVIGDETEWEEHLKELEALGTSSLDDIKAEHGIA